MKNFILMVAMLGVIAACKGGGGESAPPRAAVELKGRVHNVDSVGWRVPSLFKEAWAVTLVSNRSMLKDITNPERLQDVSLSTGIQVDAILDNLSNVDLSGYRVEIFVEHENFLTPEYWQCEVSYTSADGTVSASQSLAIVEGNTIFENDPAPTLPTCDANTGQQDICVTWFPENIDCSSDPTYKWAYYPPGDGLWKATLTNITIKALSQFVGNVGLQDGGWLTGTDKYARFIAYNSSGTEVKRKDYVFNVVP